MTDAEAWALVLENQGLVRSVIARFLRGPARQGFEFDELLTAAQLGAFRAAKTWDASKGRLSTWLVPAIRNALLRETTALEIGEKTYQHKTYAFAKNREQLAKIEQRRRTRSSRERLDDPRPDDGKLEAEPEGFEDSVIERVDIEAFRPDLRAALTSLAELHREVVLLHEVDQASFVEIGVKLDITADRAGKLYKRAIHLLRERLGERTFDG
jgi:RNA polymerase sigma factor (sigma-70 family)